MARPIRFEHHKYMGDKRTQIVYDLDLYGVHAAIDFTARLRGTERFDSVQALVTQMHEDVAQARALTGADHSDA